MWKIRYDDVFSLAKTFLAQVTGATPLLLWGDVGESDLDLTMGDSASNREATID